MQYQPEAATARVRCLSKTRGGHLTRSQEIASRPGIRVPEERS